MADVYAVSEIKIFNKEETGKIIFLHKSHNKGVKPIKNLRRKQLWQTMQTTVTMQTTQIMRTMPTIPARILPTALRIPVPRILARMQTTQITAITKLPKHPKGLPAAGLKGDRKRGGFQEESVSLQLSLLESPGTQLGKIGYGNFSMKNA